MSKPIEQSLLDSAVQHCPWTHYKDLQANAPVYEMPETGMYKVSRYDLLRTLWTDAIGDYTSQYHSIDRAGLNPLPQKSIPIWFGGFAPVEFKHAAKMGDGFIYGGSQENKVQAYRAVASEVSKVGRTAGNFGHEALMNYQSGLEHWVTEADARAEVGADYLSIRGQRLTRQGEGLSSPQEHIDALRINWDAVGDLVDGVES
ncbi:MAG: LLM class flavin-dependent oxidoreductase [Pseudomonadales bacterium]